MTDNDKNDEALPDPGKPLTADEVRARIGTPVHAQPWYDEVIKTYDTEAKKASAHAMLDPNNSATVIPNVVIRDNRVDDGFDVDDDTLEKRHAVAQVMTSVLKDVLILLDGEPRFTSRFAHLDSFEVATRIVRVLDAAEKVGIK